MQNTTDIVSRPKPIHKLAWGVRQRLDFIEYRLFWDGSLNRSDLVATFSVSVPQASKDLTLYQELAPGNAVYDKKAKCYVAGDPFEPQFMRPDSERFLTSLKSTTESPSLGFAQTREVPPVDLVVTPRREVDAVILRAILQAVREERSIEVLYQSMNQRRPRPTWRRVTPHAFGFDGFRWHARAYCHLERRFKDFLLPRISEIGSLADPGCSSADDRLWQEMFAVVIGPHPGLSPSQRNAVAKDYGMNGGESVLQIRYAMLFYGLRRLGLLGDAAAGDPRRQHIVVLNRDETEAALALTDAMPA